MADMLPQEEIDARLRQQTSPTPPAADPPVVSPYDFKHPARVNRTQLRTLESLHDNFARLLASTFSSAMREVVSVDTAFVDQTTYAEFIMSLSNPACSYQFTLGPTSGRVILDVAMPVVFAAVDRTFGGKGSSQGGDPRQVTAIEMGVINKIVKRVIEDLEATWAPVLGVEISDIELETNPEFMQITAASEIVILLAFEVNSTNASGLVSLCYPFFTLESILPRLGQKTWMRHTPINEERLLLENRLRLGPMELPLVAELGRVKIPVREANSLQAGDILRLPARAEEPAVVYLGGKPKYWVWPFAEENGELKLQVAGKIPPEQQGKYGTVR
ncbi:MAG: flagellar motor switch protein FliM [Candidatus Latescibacteria bacterium]|nr:flagellar motor switch protein FliM [Candidatus Latescibacterota bacterium]